MDELAITTGWLARLVIGGVLVLAGLAKTRNLDSFVQSLGGYRFLPAATHRPVGMVLPAFEVALGAAIIAAVVPAVTGAVAAATFLIFAGVAVLASGWQGRHDCNCFGHLAPSSVRSIVARNLALAALASVFVVSHATLTPPATLLASLIALASLAILVPSLSLAIPGPAFAAPNPGRRRFLRLAAALAGAGSLLALTRGNDVAEAACSGCGSCATQYIFIACTGGYCAAYWVRRQEYCTGGCLPCSTWQIQQFCGIPGCA